MKRWARGAMRAAAMGVAMAAGAGTALAQQPGFLDVRGEQIVDGSGRPVILRGMGLGGWMLKEGYMLDLGEVGQQHVIHRKLAELVGEDGLAAFQQAWLDHHMTKADMDALARWGFNSVRLPMHHALFLADDGPDGTVRFNEEGFRRLDALLGWAAANRMWVMLDLHAAPGGQGTDNAISDRDPSQPSLWESEDNQRRTVALWREIARRYADNPWVGGYDILNEPNWDFEGAGGGHGCSDKRNGPIKALYKRITAAIRTEDRRHLIVIEGNCWGNNFAGIRPDWDDKLVLSFHKYWNRNDEKSVADILALGKATGRPVWLGESGENSNGWYRDAIGLVEGHGVGWAWWPLKKIGFNQPLEVVPNPGWKKIVAWMTGKSDRPARDEALAAMMTLASHDIAYDNTVEHRDVIEAMMREPHRSGPRPFKAHRAGRGALEIAAADYDLGGPGVAYADTHDGDLHVAVGGERIWWNDGRTYRNDGVDIGLGADGSPHVAAFEAGEWLHYTLEAERTGMVEGRLLLAAGGPAALWVSINGGARLPVAVTKGEEWDEVALPGLLLLEGTNRLVIGVERGSVRLKAIRFP